MAGRIDVHERISVIRLRLSQALRRLLIVFPVVTVLSMHGCRQHVDELLLDHKGQLGGRSEQLFEVPVRRGTLLRITLDQDKIDAELTITDPGGASLGTFESDSERNGMERAAVAFKSTGKARISVRSRENSEASGTIVLKVFVAKRHTAADAAFTRGADTTSGRSLHERARSLERAGHLFYRSGSFRAAAVAWHGASRLEYRAHASALRQSELARRSLQASERQGNPSEVADGAFLLAATLSDYPDFSEDVEKQTHALLDRAETVYRDSEDLIGLGHVYLARGLVRYRGNEPVLAKAAWDLAAQTCSGVRQRICEARAKQNIAVVTRFEGQPEAAISLLRDALRLFAKEDRERLYADIHDNLAFTLESVNRFDDALHSHAAALVSYIAKGDCSDVTRSFAGIGYSLFGVGDFSQAIRFYDLALHSGCSPRAMEGVQLNPKYRTTEEVQSALASGQLCASVQQRALGDSNDRDNAIWAASDLGDIARTLGYATAAQCHAVARSLTQNRRDAYRSELLEAQDLLDSGEVTAAQDALEKIRANLHSDSGTDHNRPWRLARALFLSGRASAAEADHPSAVAQLTEAVKQFTAVNRFNDKFDALTELAIVQVAAGQVAEAEATFVEADALLDQLQNASMDPTYRAALVANRRILYEAWLDASLATAATLEGPAAAVVAAKSLNISERSRARVLRQLASSLSGRTQHDPALVDWSLRGILSDIISPGAQGESELAKIGKLLDRDPGRALPQFAPTGDAAESVVRPTGIDQSLGPIGSSIIDRAKPDRSMVEYFLGRSNSYAWTITSRGIIVHRLPGRESIRESARRVIEHLSSAKHNLDELDRALETLHEQLITPIERDLVGSELLIVADDILSQIPFSALRNPRTGEYLLQRWTIASTPALGFAGIRPSLARDQTAKRVLIVGDPLLDESRRARDCATHDPAVPSRIDVRRTAVVSTSLEPWQPLPGTSREIVEVTDIFRSSLTASVEILDRCRATRMEVLQGNLGSYSYIHFASHAINDTDVPGRSGILLTASALAGAPVEVLTAQDIASMRLNAELVVLNGCTTAGSRYFGGEGLLGLPYAVMVAGVPRTISTLWAVQDEMATNLMTDFYRAYVSDRSRTAAALRQAQLGALATTRWRSPKYWSAYVLSERQ